MRRLDIFILILISTKCFSQITVINTGTTSELTPASIIGKNIMINGIYSYLVKSYDECDNLISCNAPGPLGYLNTLWRNDTSNIYMLSTSSSAYNTRLYKSVDGGSNWALRLDTPGYYVPFYTFFDTLEGVALGTFGKMIRTKDGGKTWTSGSQPLSVLTTIKNDRDSTVIVGGNAAGSGGFMISKDRGNTWLPGVNLGGGNPQPMDFFFLNRDTIFGIATAGWDGSSITKSFNGGKTWQVNTITSNPLIKPLGMFVKSNAEIYVAGSRDSWSGSGSQSRGIILKSVDLGQSWEIYYTDILSGLTGISFLNDSIALVSGYDGVLFKWNSKQTVFSPITGLDENAAAMLDLSVYPNPLRDKLYFKGFESRGQNFQLKIINAFGQIVYDNNNISVSNEIDLSFLSSGIYCVEIEGHRGRKVLKLVKE